MVIDIGLENREIKPTLAYGRIKKLDWATCGEN
jgi:hypothetical protein